MKYLSILAVIFLLLTTKAQAHVDFIDIKPISLEVDNNNSYIFTFFTMGTEKVLSSDKKITLSIRFNPKCYTQGIQQPELNDARRKQYQEAMALLKTKVKADKAFTFGFKANRIKGTKDRYQAEDLRILHFNGKEVIRSIASDLGIWSCKN